MDFSIGSDPEFFLQKEKYKSAIGILPSRENAIKKNECLYYYDNVLAEAQLKPANSKNEFIKNIQNCLKGLISIINPYEISLISALNFPENELKDKDARIAACNPEWCAYSLTQNLAPQEIIMNTPFRTAGGHIHLGCNLLHEGIFILNTIKMLDLFLGIPSILLDKDKTAKDRRKIYGLAGSHRIPNHGVEYRTLGNFWLNSPELANFVYDVCNFVLNFVSEKGYEKFWSINEELLDADDPSLAYYCFGYDINLMRKAINNCDKKTANKFMLIVKNYWPDYITKTFDFLENKEFNLYKEWNL